MSKTETIITDPNTGGQKASKLARYDLIPSHVLEALAEHYGRGAQKYADRNWEKGYRWGLSFAALMRHAWAWWRGEDVDEETGSSHMIAVAWHALALAEFQRTGKGTDDRPAWVPGVDLVTATGEALTLLAENTFNVKRGAMTDAELRRACLAILDTYKAPPAPPVWDGTWPPPVGAEIEVASYTPPGNGWVRTRVDALAEYDDTIECQIPDLDGDPALVWRSRSRCRPISTVSLDTGKGTATTEGSP